MYTTTTGTLPWWKFEQTERCNHCDCKTGKHWRQLQPLTWRQLQKAFWLHGNRCSSKCLRRHVENSRQLSGDEFRGGIKHPNALLQEEVLHCDSCHNGSHACLTRHRRAYTVYRRGIATPAPAACTMRRPACPQGLLHGACAVHAWAAARAARAACTDDDAARWDYYCTAVGVSYRARRTYMQYR